MFGNGLGGFHNDVLNAIPKDLESVTRLTTELKNRAVSSIKSGNYPEAITLYTKAIEINGESVSLSADGNANTVSILFANRSMCHLKMNNCKDALSDANLSIDKDSQYAKAYYRKAMALINLKDYTEARATLILGLGVKPDDKELQDQLNKLSSLGSSTPSSSSGGSAPASTTKTAATTTTPTAKPSTSPKKTSTKIADDDEEEEKSAAPIRGYKTTSDGRKTTFFNNELDEQTKALIGDIAPKKLDSIQPDAAAPPSSTGSAWNTAGTFESVNWTKWASDRLRELVSEVAVQTPDKDVDIRVSSIESLAGDAEIVSNRGKVKRIYDFTLALKWQATKISDSACTANGSLTICDITADDDYEVSAFKVEGGSKIPGVEQHIKASSGCFQKGVISALHKFCAEFKNKP